MAFVVKINTRQDKLYKEKKMAKLSLHEIERQANQISTVQELKAQIQATLKYFKSNKTAFYQAYFAQCIKLGLIKKISEFDDLVEEAEFDFVKLELDRCLVQYQQTEDKWFKRWLKFKLIKKFPQFIKNEKTFNEYNQQFSSHFQPCVSLKVETIEDFHENDTVDFLVENLIPQQGLISLTGSSKIGKSSLACEIAYSVATGQPLFNNLPTKCGTVVVVSLDETKAETGSKYMARGFLKSPDAKKNLKFLYSLDFENLTEIEELLKEYKPSLIVLDNLKRLTASLNISENSTKLGYLLSDLSTLLAKNNCAGLIINDSNKSKTGGIIDKIKGSSAITRATSANLLLEKKGEQLTLTAVGRDIPETEYHLLLNNRNHWQTHGIYHLENPEIEPAQTTTVEPAPIKVEPTQTTIVEPAPTEVEPTQTATRQGRKKVTNKETIKIQCEQMVIPGLFSESVIMPPTNKKKRPKRPSLEEKIKNFTHQNENITRDEVIYEATRLVIQERYSYKALMELVFNGEFRKYPQGSEEEIEGYDTYYGVRQKE